MFLSPRAEIQAAWLPDTGCESCWHQKWPSLDWLHLQTTQSSSRSLGWLMGHERDHWTSSLGFPAPSDPQHSPPPNGTQAISACEPHYLLLEKKTWMAPTHPFTSPRGAGHYICSCGGGHGEAGTGPATPGNCPGPGDNSSPYNSFSTQLLSNLCEISTWGAKIIHRQWPSWVIRVIDKPPAWETWNSPCLPREFWPTGGSSTGHHHLPLIRIKDVSIVFTSSACLGGISFFLLFSSCIFWSKPHLYQWELPT